MILGISIGRTFDDYGYLYKVLSSIEFIELTSVPNQLAKRFVGETNKPFQEIAVYWDDLRNCKNIKKNQFGKEYNGDAMKDAMYRFSKYADQIVEFGGGAYLLPKEGKEKLIMVNKIKNKGGEALTKLYKF